MAIAQGRPLTGGQQAQSLANNIKARHVVGLTAPAFVLAFLSQFQSPFLSLFLSPFRLRPLLLVCAVCLTAPAISAQGIYTCVDSKGRRLTADRPIADCMAKEQQVLNNDGSVRTVHPPTLTAEERLEKEAKDRAVADARAALADATRRDRNLMTRYPSEAAHQRARESSLDTVRLAIRSTEVRLRDLLQERKPLGDEAEFYQGKPLPGKLKAAIDANDAARDAQKAAAANQEAELGRINKLYDAELDRLRRLWAGAQPGSMGALPSFFEVKKAAPAKAPVAAASAGNASAAKTAAKPAAQP
jgi:hypothetical protein